MPDIAGRRWLFLYLVLASTALAATQMTGVLQADGVSLPEIGILILYAILFAWISASFWVACFGAWALNRNLPVLPLNAAQGPSAARTAILMPVYNEDVARVFSGVRAMWEAAGADFDFYILSDSTRPDAWVAEEMAWHRLRQELNGAENIFYRHRPSNTARKAGNIQDFCENWGQLYDYMVILDADSLMTGEVLTKLVGLMDANPRAGLIQAPAGLVGRSSLFARIQQFASSVYGPIHVAGLAWLQGADGNYYGHNAIIRVHAFMQCCGLPRLPGKPPFGGEIMSHDFIEAALMRRAGWDVWMAAGLEGSYEEPPPTVHDYLLRDRRWCQGNLQHLRVVFAGGLALPSRLHLAMGIMSYVSSPLWLLLLVVSAVDMMQGHAGTAAPLVAPAEYAMRLVLLVMATLALLYVPKLLALWEAMKQPRNARAHGGEENMLWSMLVECVFSTLLAPVMMLQHSWYVFTILLGIATGWGSQQRGDHALSWRFAARNYWPHTAIGVASAVTLWWLAPAAFAWFVPLLAGLVLAIPVVVVTSSVEWGERLRRHKLFLVPSESRGLPVLERAHALEAGYAQARPDAHRLVLEDAGVRGLHLSLLAEAHVPAADPIILDLLRRKAASRETGSFSREDWNTLLLDAEGLRGLS